MARPLEDYAFLSDCRSAALVAKDGTVDWLTFPRFDSAACFASLLGKKENGHWTLSPSQDFEVKRCYREGTLVLETTFITSTGECVLVDCMLYGEDHPTFARELKCTKGSVDFSMELIIGLDYGRIEPWIKLEKEKRELTALGGPDGILFTSGSDFEIRNNIITSTFTIKEDEKKHFLLTWYPSHMHRPHTLKDPEGMVERTTEFWRKWQGKGKYKGFEEKEVRKSLTVLKGLTYLPSGAIIAAPTTSLPEEPGGVRNWDYRFSWIRDSSFTLAALLRAGYTDEAIKWKEWLLRSLAGRPSQASIMYGIMGERRLPELEVPWLDGYGGSKPVRIGNAAHQQFQLDVFGELLSSSVIARREGIHPVEHSWQVEKEIVDFVCDNWQRPDEGIWEMRNGRKHFVHSKLMAWKALSCALECMDKFGLPGEHQKWEEIRDRIHRDICENGYDHKKKSFVQYYGSDNIDASLLMMAKLGFLPSDDPRIVGTVEAIQRELMENGLVKRYLPESGVDGLPGKEGCFLPCSFWMVDNLRLLGRNEEAMELFHHLQSLRNDLGLYAEEYSVSQKRLVGNFPQGFSHIGHAVSAMGLESMLEHNNDGEEVNGHWKNIVGDRGRVHPGMESRPGT
jgi:GH15 family glucan-1,4-alpha-glucosidase